MGLFSRRSKDEPGAADDTPAPGGPGLDVEGPELPEDYDGRPITSPLTEAARGRISAALEEVAARGVDVDDLASIGAGYDTAYRDDESGRGPGSDVVVELFGMAIGEHLARHSARSWAIVTDVFGTDLGIVAARADTVIVPHNLVSARWMRGETGWVPGVVSHLVSMRPRA